MSLHRNLTIIDSGYFLGIKGIPLSDNLCTFGFSFSVDMLQQIYRDGAILILLG